MATISKLVIEMMADPQGVKTGLDKAEGYLRQFGKTADQALATSKRGAAGQALADNIIGSLQDKLTANTDRIREQLFRGILDPKAAAEHARQAAQAMNTTILASLAELRTRGLATPEIEHQLVGQLSNAGLAVEQQATRTLGGFGRIRNGLVSLFASMSGTIPILDRIGGQLGQYAVGGGIMIAVVAGITAIAFAWEKWTEKTREAKKAMEEFQKTDDAYRAKSKASAATSALLSGLPGNTASQIDVIGQTKAIDDLQKAVRGYQDALRAPDNTYIGRLNAVNQELVALRTRYVDGKISLAQFNTELAREALLHPDYAPNIAQTAELVAQYDAARKALTLLTAAEQQRKAVEANTRATYGTTPDLAKQLDRTNQMLAAFAKGGKHAVEALQDQFKAFDDAEAAWQKYVETADGAKFATLAFTDALRLHIPVAQQAYRAALEITEGQRKLSEEITKTPLKELSETAELLIRAREQAQKFGLPYKDLGKEFAAVLVRANAALRAETNQFSDTALKLRAVIADLEGAFLNFGKIPDIKPVIPSKSFSDGSPSPIYVTPQTLASTPRDQFSTIQPTTFVSGIYGSGNTDPWTGRRPFSAPGFSLPLPQAAALPTNQPSIAELRLRATVQTVGDALRDVGAKFRDLAASSFFGILRSIGAQLNPFAQIVTALATAAKPIVPIMTQLANIVAAVLTPVFQAFAPVLQALLPFFDALFRVLSPILRALAPLFMAFIPILNALFPVIKLAAIAFTYVVQAASYLAAIFFKVAGGFTTLVGGVIAAIGAVISKIPFLGGFGKSIQNAGNDIKNLGHAMDATADGLFQTADAMAKARDEINSVNIDPTQTALDGLTKATDAATGALNNVPTGYKVALARFLSTSPVNVKPPLTPTPPTPTPVGGGGGKLPYPAPNTGDGGGSGGGSGGGGDDGGGHHGPAEMSMVFQDGAIRIDARSLSASELFDRVRDEGMRRARAEYGPSGITRWGEVTT